MNTSLPISPHQLLYGLCILSMFLLYGSSVRKGVFRGSGILWAGVFTGVLAVAVSLLFEAPYFRQGIALGFLLINPAIWAALTVFCVVTAYSQQRVRTLATYQLGDSKFLVLSCPPIRIPDADALIVPVSNGLRLTDPISRLIAGAGGPDLQTELGSIGAVKSGKVVSTGPGKLAVGRVFYAAVGETGKRIDSGVLRRGMESAAQQARKANAESLAIPLGPQPGLTLADSFEATIGAALRQRKAFAEIVFLVFDPRTAGLAKTVAERLVKAEEPLKLSPVSVK